MMYMLTLTKHGVGYECGSVQVLLQHVFMGEERVGIESKMAACADNTDADVILDRFLLCVFVSPPNT